MMRVRGPWMRRATRVLSSAERLASAERLLAEHHVLSSAELSTVPAFSSTPAIAPVLTSLNTIHKPWSDPSVYTRTRQPVSEAHTLPGMVYHDESFFKFERERVFQSSWVAVAEICELSKSGDVMPATVGGANILLANDKGTIRAFHNVCRHRGAKLVTEKCSKRRTILCPYHRWGYALDGRLLATPSFDADAEGKAIPLKVREQFCTNHVKDFDKESNSLYPVRVDFALGLAFVNLNGEAPPLTEWLGDLLPALSDYEEQMGVDGPGLKAYTRKTYDVSANWKLLMENYLEYYHLPAVHPELCDVSGVDEVAIFPNTFFSVYPDALFRVILSPQSAGRTIEHATFLSHEDGFAAPDGDAILEDMYQFWDLINTQDIEIVENVQEGTASAPYRGGRFSFRFEEPVHRFQNMVVDKMLDHEPTRYRVPEGDEDYSPLHETQLEATL